MAGDGGHLRVMRVLSFDAAGLLYPIRDDSTLKCQRLGLL